MEKRQTEIKNLRKNGFVLIDDVPCRVDDVSVSRPGKHGGAKARLTATGVFDNQKRTIVKPGDARIDVPVIEKRPAQVLAIIGNNIQLMDLQDFSNFEIKKPDFDVKEGDEILIWRYGNNVQIMGKK